MKKTPETISCMNDFLLIREKHPEKTISDIADGYGISKWTIYGFLDELAKKSGKSREQLLLVPHKPHLIKKAKILKNDVEQKIEGLKDEDFKEKVQNLNRKIQDFKLRINNNIQ